MWCVGRDCSENTNSSQGPIARVINGLTGYDESGAVFCLFFIASGIEQSSELVGYHKTNDVEDGNGIGVQGSTRQCGHYDNELGSGEVEQAKQ